MAIDLGSIIQLLEEDPTQRAALRRAIFGDDSDLSGALALLTQRVEELAAAQVRTEQRLDQLAAAQVRTEQRLDTLTQRVDLLAKDLRGLAGAQRDTQISLKALIDTVKGMNDKLAKLDGASLEGQYRQKGHAYLSVIARRLRLLDSNELNAMLDRAEDAEILSHREVNDVLLADAVFSGRRRQGLEPLVHLVVEVSVTIHRNDVRRATERAEMLARVVDTEVIPVVAGEMVPTPVILAAQEAGVWTVTNGHTVSPDDDVEGL